LRAENLPEKMWLAKNLLNRKIVATAEKIVAIVAPAENEQFLM